MFEFDFYSIDTYNFAYLLINFKSNLENLYDIAIFDYGDKIGIYISDSNFYGNTSSNDEYLFYSWFLENFEDF